MKTERIDVGHITLNVAMAGDGPPLVMLHGLGWSHHLWDRHLATLSSTYRVIAPDTRGHGLSDVPPGPYSIAQYCDDLVALLDTLKLDRVTLIGFSQGGMTALTMATQHQQRLDALGVFCAVARSHPDGQANMEKRIAAMAEQGPNVAARIAGESIFSPAFIARNSDYFDAFVAERTAADPAGLVPAMRAGVGYDTSSGLSRISVPTLMLAGENDRLAPPAAVRAVADAIPGARFHELEGCGHMIQIEAPAQFDAYLTDFLRDALPPSS